MESCAAGVDDAHRHAIVTPSGHVIGSLFPHALLSQSYQPSHLHTPPLLLRCLGPSREGPRATHDAMHARLSGASQAYFSPCLIAFAAIGSTWSLSAGGLVVARPQV